MLALLCIPSELLDMYMGKLEEQLDRSEDSFRNMSSLLLLLQHFPADMEPLFQQDMVTFFTNQLPVINQLRFASLPVSAQHTLWCGSHPEGHLLCCCC